MAGNANSNLQQHQASMALNNVFLALQSQMSQQMQNNQSAAAPNHGFAAHQVQALLQIQQQRQRAPQQLHFLQQLQNQVQQAGHSQAQPQAQVNGYALPPMAQSAAVAAAPKRHFQEVSDNALSVAAQGQDQGQGHDANSYSYTNQNQGKDGGYRLDSSSRKSQKMNSGSLTTTTNGSEAHNEAFSIASSPVRGTVLVPCRARGMPVEHNFKVRLHIFVRAIELCIPRCNFVSHTFGALFLHLLLYSLHTF
jgi:hypothetical protein